LLLLLFEDDSLEGVEAGAAAGAGARAALVPDFAGSSFGADLGGGSFAGISFTGVLLNSIEFARRG
jgi:hypothetical protein